MAELCELSLPLSLKILTSFSNDDGDSSKNVLIKMNSNVDVKFPGVEFLETAPKFRKRKKHFVIFVCLCPP